EEVLEAQARRAVMCVSCGAALAIGESLKDATGPMRCPRCLRRLSDFIELTSPPKPSARPAVGRTQEMKTTPPPPGPGSCLHVEPKEGESADVDVPEDEGLVVGRAPGKDGFLIADISLSRKHCEFSFRSGGLVIEDLGSRNGTFVNGERVVNRGLRPGDEIEIGESRILVRSPPAGGARASNSTELWRAEGLCVLCGVVIPADDIAAGRAQGTPQGLTCSRCLGVALFPGRILGGYRILEQIGFGGMAKVYRAEKVSGGRIVAVKTLLDPKGASPQQRERFVREARASARLEHPNLVRVYDAGEHSGIPYIVMEYIEGEDLAGILDRRGKIEVGRSVDITLDVAAALTYAHEHGIVHRDVKPGNIILDAVYGRARLLDLGVAKVLDFEEEVRLTRTGMGIGTLEYAAPEQIESANTVDGRADIYALGATLYRMVVGRRPFVATRELALARAILQNPVTWPDEAVARVPADLRAAVEKAMEKRPSDRFRTAEDFRAALAKVRESLI
ncbi:MAG: protein kinase domain-containing protein, partial [Planctomycetota bacterium]